LIPVILLLCLGGLMHAVRSYTGDEIGSELAFGFLLLAAYFTGKIVNRFGMPKLTGYIIAGVVSGPYVLELVSKPMNGSLKVVADLATCILALTAGSELNLRKLKPVMKTLRAMTLFAVIGAQFAIAAMLFVLGSILHLIGMLDGLSATQALAACFVCGVALSAQSPAVMMAILSETGAEGPLSQVMLGSVVLADFVVLIMYSAASSLALAVIGGGVDLVETSLKVIWELLGSVVFGVAIGVLISRYVIAVKHGATLFIVLVCVVVAEIGTRVELDSLIVMLAAGIYLENFSKANAHELLHGLQMAELPVFLVFFALAGGKIHIDEVVGAMGPVVIIAATRVAVFYFGSKMACRATGAQEVVAKYAWFGLVPQSGLALALALLILNTFPDPMFGPKASLIVFGVVAINELISPVVLRAMILRSGEAGRRAAVKIGH
jgi:Kef-type K+ transport system membrane component KefB